MARPVAGGTMTHTHLTALAIWHDTGQIDPATWRELIRRGLIRKDRYGSWVLTGAGKDLYHQHKKEHSS